MPTSHFDVSDRMAVLRAESRFEILVPNSHMYIPQSNKDVVKLLLENSCVAFFVEGMLYYLINKFFILSLYCD